MDIEFEIYEENGKWVARCKDYLVLLESDSLDGLVDEIRRWVRIRFPGKNVRILLKTRNGEPRFDLYVPGPSLPIKIDPGMFRV